MAAVELAELGRRRASDKDFIFRCGTIRRSEFQRFRVNGSRLHAFGRIEVFYVFVAGQRRRSEHEIRPDGRSRCAAGQAEVAVVVKTYPDDANEIRGVSGEPAIAGGSGFPCGGQSKSVRADGGSGAAIENVF